jgi:hydroxymethylpyrimidine pyrophosphatase-like HAD family hydrolase
MSYSKEAYQYLETDHIRLLIAEEGLHKVPSVEQRILEAFDAGRRSVTKSYSNLDCFSQNVGKINFPRT